MERKHGCSNGEAVWEARANQAQGAKDIGLNQQSMLDSQKDHGHGTDLQRTVLRPLSTAKESKKSPLNAQGGKNHTTSKPRGFGGPVYGEENTAAPAENASGTDSNADYFGR